MKKLILSTILISFSTLFHTQINTDSLISIFKNQENSIEKIETGFTITNALINQDNEQALNFAIQTKKIAIDINDSLNIALCLDDIGELSRKLGNYEEAITALNSSLTIKNNPKYEEGKETTFNILGKVYANKGNYDLSVENFIGALSIMEAENNKEGQAFYLNNIGIVFDLQGVYDKALEYYIKSLEIKKEIGMEDAFAASYNNIAIAYYNLDKVEISLTYHKKALKENIRLNKQSSIARSHNNIGFAHIDLQNYNQAIVHLRKALKIRTKLSDNRAIAQTEINIATAFNELNLLDSALLHVKRGTHLSDSISAKEILDDGYELLSDIYINQNNFEKALTYYQLYSSLKDTLRNEDAFSKIVEMEAKYNLVKKEKEIQAKDFEIEKNNLELAEEKNARYFYITFLIGFILTTVLIGFGYFQKRRISLLLKTQNLLIKKNNETLRQTNLNLNTELKDKTKILDTVYTKTGNTDLPDELLALSKREMEVLSYLALGWTDQQISEKLFVSKSTTKTHLRRIYAKLLVNGRAGAVAIAHKHNIIGGID